MNRTDMMQEVSRRVRQDPSACLWAVGYLTTMLPSDELEHLLEGLRELQGTETRPDHWTAYLERWGRLPAI